MCRVGGRIEKERVHGELYELHVFRSPYLYRPTFDLPYFTADFPPIFLLADRAVNPVPRSCKVLLWFYFTSMLLRGFVFLFHL